MTLAAAGSMVVLVALAGGLLYYRSAVLPQVSGSLPLIGLKAKVDVVRDKEGVPHIFASSDHDAMMALGFAHAQDRLWQMEMNRRIANGRVAEILGSKALEIDVMLRTLGVRRSAEAIYATMDAEVKASFDAYAKGVNAYLAQQSGPLPPEFLLTSAPKPENWSPVDSIGWVIMMAWDLGGNWTMELFRMQLAQAGLSLQQINELTPNRSGDPMPANLRDLTALYKEARAASADATRLMAAVPSHVDGMGSNNWVVAGALSETGKPLLANDPHLGLSAPALWYFAALETPDYKVIGASLPGVPGIVLGRNDRIAWGFTNTGPDVQDLFLEKLVADRPDHYMTPQGPQPFQRFEERIKVKGEADKVIQVRVSRHGPVISDGGHEVATQSAPKGYAIAFQWTALSPDNRTPHAAWKMARAKNWPEFVSAIRDFHAPQQNMVYADIDGNIGYYAPGKVPIRHKDNDLYGMMPAPGWEAHYDWAGFIPFEELPQSFNPKEGYRITANEKIVGPDYPYFLTTDWAAPYRANRIAALMKAQPKHSAASFQAIQADDVSLAMRDILPLLLAAPVTGEREQAAVASLKAFDGKMAVGRVEPLIAAAWVRELTRLVYRDELGALFADNFDQRPIFLTNVLRNHQGMARWCDDVTTPVAETCHDMIAKALTLALEDLTRRYGAAMTGWRWGTAHEARSTHRPFGSVPMLAWVFDVRVPVSGDTFTVNAMRHKVGDDTAPFTALHGPSLRAIYDFSDLEQSQFIHSTGQSGVVLSPLYGNLAERWGKNQFIPMQLGRASAEKDAIGTLTLTP